jgi:hypothetical protein
MIGINKAPISLDLETVFTHVLVGIAPKAIGRGEMVAVIVQNPLINIDGTTNTSQMFLGSATNIIYSMIPGQESPVVYAEDQKDVYVRLDFPAINPNGGILTGGIANIANRGTGYTVGNVLTLTPSQGGTNSTITVTALDGRILTAVVNNGGSGYVPGNILHVTGGNTFGRITVDTVDGLGAILTAHVSQTGNGYVTGTNGTTVGGDGLATFDITASTGVFTFNVTTPGTGFFPGETVAATGGTGAGAVITVDTVNTITPETADVNLLIYRLRKGGKQ